MSDAPKTMCSFPWEMYSVDVGFGWWRPCPRIDFQKLNDLDLFNHDRLKLLRKNLRSNVQDELCNKCWDDEKRGLRSYRQVLNQDRLNEFADSTELSSPTILEIKFQNYCNLKCMFCSRNCSSQWEASEPFEASELGSIKGEMAKQASYELLEREIDNIRTIQVFGGEPVLHPEFSHVVKTLNRLAPEGGKELSFSTNLFFSPKIMSRFIEEIEEVLRSGHKLYLRVSIDGVGQQGEYLREGLKWSVFERNLFILRDFLAKQKDFGRAKCNIALNILNLTSLGDIVSYLQSHELTLFQPHYNYVGKPSMLTLSSFGEKIAPAVQQVRDTDFGIYQSYKDHVLSLAEPVARIAPNTDSMEKLKLFLSTQAHFTYNEFFEAFPNNEYIREALR